MKVIKNHPERCRLGPNLVDYDRACAAFSWKMVERGLGSSPDHGSLNIAYYCVDRHAAGPRRKGEVLQKH